jgi:hypothetical protein
MNASSLAQQVDVLLEPLLTFCGGNYKVVAFISFAFLSFIKATAGKRGGIDWYALAHASIVSSGALFCAYLDIYASDIDIHGVPEPLRSVRCAPPLTRLHSVIPMISLGYAALDLFDGIMRRRIDNILHGVILGVLMVIVCELGSQHLTTYGLIMEMSTVPLNLLKVEWSRPVFGVLTSIAFVGSFFIGRIIVVPWLWMRWILTYRDEVIVGHAASCYPDYFFGNVYVGFGACFHLLNVYWMILIAQGALRKLQGKPREKKER